MAMTAELGPLHSSPDRVVRLPRPSPRSRTSGLRLLVVDPHADPDVDAARLAAELHAESGGHSFRVTCVRSTLDGLVELGRAEPAVVVVAPDSSGVPATDFVAAVRTHSTALVVAALTSADAAEAGPLMLAGAAAAVIRPYTGHSLWRTVSSVPGGLAMPGSAPELVGFGPLEVDARSYVVRVDGEPIADLPAKEFEMLRALATHAPAVVSNDDLRVALWGDGGGRSDNTLAVHATRLRHRLAGVAHIRRIRGRGYSLTLW